MDTTFTARLQRFLERTKTPASRTRTLLIEGAELLLRINRNRTLHRNIITRTLWEKLIYEIRKHLRYRLDGLTRADLANYEQSVMPILERTARLATETETSAPTEACDAPAPTEACDAPALPPTEKACDAPAPTTPPSPPELQAIPERNAQRIKKMAALHAHLRRLQNAQPCDRYEYIQQLVNLDRHYHTDWQRYDDYYPPETTPS